MNQADFQLQGFEDSRLAVHAASALPAWLWSPDGTRISWANPVGARLLGAANATELATRIFGPADQQRRQVAQLAGRLPPFGAIRLERLRGFGASLGMLLTCGCARLDFADGSHGILIAATERTGRAMSLPERLRLLVEGIDAPIAAFTGDGMLAGASAAARPLFGFRDLAEAGLEEIRRDALGQGHAETAVGTGHMLLLQRIGYGADIGLIALITPVATEAALPVESPQQPAPHVADYEQPAQSNEAPAEFALIDEFAEPSPESIAGEPSPETPANDIRRHPLRFMWQMDRDGRFSLDSGEFMHLIGAHTAAGFGRPWSEIAEAFALDPDGQILNAIASRTTWSGITLNWPADGGGRLPVELSGLPLYDPAQNFAGYRGFGVCRDIDGMSRLAALRRHDLFTDPPASQTLSATIAREDRVSDEATAVLPAEPGAAPAGTPESHPSDVSRTSQPTDLETPVETPKNVLPFRPLGEQRPPVLTPVENSAFNELARQLSARLDRDDGAAATDAAAPAAETVAELPAAPEKSGQASEPPANQTPEWLAPPEPPARGEVRRDKALLDLLPFGVLIYRLDRLLYANPAFLKRMGYDSLHALEQAGGLDALYVESLVSTASSTSDTGTAVTISATQASPEHAPPSATDARLYTISWDDDPALALIFSVVGTENAAAIAAALPAAKPSAVGHADAEELGAILDTTAEGIVMFDAGGNINSCNRSAEALFGYDGNELAQRNLADLFAPESQRVVRDYLDSTKGADIASLLDHGRDVLGLVRQGGIIPLSMTMGRTRPEGPNFFAVFRDLSQTKKAENELVQAQRLADRSATAKADMLARISHEIRTPLNAIIGFAEVMIGERFGKLGNERYVEYMKDVRASGERVITILNDLTDLSRIETGNLNLAFANQNLNDLVESCVAVMQPQANRERIIIRTSLAHMLPPVVADNSSLRQITLNLIGNSIHLANAGGQVIVSTALSDFGEVVLRVRDTGASLNDNEVAAAMEPFRTSAPSDQASDGAAVNLSLTKALVEANRAKFQIKTGPRSGTLIEVVFSHAGARA
jgi:PAS domain S-box-containing protein